MSVTSYSVTGRWPLCVITSDQLISPPKLILLQNSLHLHSLCMGILFNSLPCQAIHFICKTSLFTITTTRLGGEIYLSDINIHTGCCLVNCVLLHNPLNLKVAYQNTVNSLYCRHCGDVESVSSLARVRDSGSLFQSNVCNIFAGDLAAVRIIGVSVIAGCPQGES